MDNQETVQAAIDSLRQDVEGLKTLLHLKDTKMELLLANLAKTENALAAAEQRMDDLLLGSIATFAMPEPPEGWLVCDGQEVSRQTYARLFAKIGTTFGEGDYEETFNLPDLRGVFVRGWDEEREFGSQEDDQMQGHTHKDGGHNHQGDTNSTGNHRHKGVLNKNEINEYCRIDKCTLGRLWSLKDQERFFIVLYNEIFESKLRTHIFWQDNHSHNLEINSAGSHSHSFSTASAAANLGLPSALSHGTPRCGDETRPANVALLFCIKY